MELVHRRVADALQRFLQWSHEEAEQFVRQCREPELDDAAEHLAAVANCSVGLAAVVYAVRLRLAGDDGAKRRAAAEEAYRHSQLLGAVRPSRPAQAPAPRRSAPIAADPHRRLQEKRLWET